MPIMAKTNNGYKEVKIIKTLNTEVDYILSKVGNTYERTFTVIRELTDIPFLQFKSIKPHANLLNYRIYGNTVNGESVGDRTANLFDGELLPGFWDSTTTITNTSSTAFRSFKLLLPAGTYTFSVTTEINMVRLIVDGALIQNVGNNITSYTVTSTTDGYIGFSFRITGTTQTPWDDSPIMLNSGSTALPYEPYGYRVPVMVSNGTDTQIVPIYLPEQIRKVGDEAEYIDYGEQKQHRVRKNLFDVTAQHTVAYNTCYKYVISGLNPNLNYTCSTNYNQENHTDACVYFCGALTQTNGVWQNEPKTYKPNNDGEIIILIRFIQYHESLPIYDAVVSGDIWIMVNSGSTALPYEPYITYTELDVTLPTLPTLSGTNTLSVGTEVQPSKVYVKGNIKY